MKKINKILIIFMMLVGIIYSFDSIKENDLYNTLIRLSIIPVILLPFIIEKYTKLKMSEYSKEIYIIFIFLSYFLGSIINLYSSIFWYDTFTHTIFGFLWSFFILEMLIRLDHFDNKKYWFNIIFIISLIALLAVLWETFEFTCDNLFEKDAQRVLLTGVVDTMKDMIVAYLGSIFFCFMYMYEHIFNKKYIVNKFINNIK